MGFLETVFGPSYGPQTAIGSLGSFRTYTGETVDVAKAMAFTPTWSAIRLISGSVGNMPLLSHREVGPFREPVTDDRARMLQKAPNKEQSGKEFWALMDSFLLAWGNAFAYKVLSSYGEVVELWPISPARVGVARDKETGEREFWIEGERYTEFEILHIRSLSEDGTVGYSPIQQCRNAIAVGRAQEEFQGSFMGNDGRPASVLTHPNALQPEAAARLKASWEKVKTGGTAVLEEGIKVEQLTMPLEDAQFIEQMNFSDKRIAQIFNLPPGKLAASTGDSLTYSTTESQNREFYSHTLQDHFTTIEEAVNRDRMIIPDSKVFCEFNVDALLRANTKERMETHKIALEANILTLDEVRAIEKLPQLSTPPSSQQGATIE